MEIKKHKNFINSTRKMQNVEYIVIHNSAMDKGAEVTANMNYDNSFLTKYRNAFAHFYVDSKEVVQLGDIEREAWHVGNPAKWRKESSYLNVANNKNSVGIEICENNTDNFAKAEAKAIELIKFLVKQNPKLKLTLHYFNSNTACPYSSLQKNVKNAQMTDDSYLELLNFFNSEVFKS